MKIVFEMGAMDALAAAQANIQQAMAEYQRLKDQPGSTVILNKANSHVNDALRELTDYHSIVETSQGD